MAKLQSSINLLTLLTIMGGQALIVEAALAQAATTETAGRSEAISDPNEAATDIAAVSEAQPATTVVEWQAQIDASLVQITSIQVEATEAGLQVTIEADGELASPSQSVSGNALVLEIPNTTLTEAVQEFEPVEGIALVQATALPGGIVRLAITGNDAVPVVNISTEAAGLVLGVTPGLAQASAEEDAIQLVVTGEEEDGYRAPDATTATRTDSPLQDIPQSIQVIPRQIIEDEQAIGIEDVLDNVAGVNYQGNDDGRGTRFNIRGFGGTGSPILRDGFRVYNSGNNAAAPEVANLERIEVLRGPASVLYGEADPGGVINLVTEQPLSEPYYNVQLQVGSQGLISPSLDFSGPVTEDGRVRYRLNALVRREGSFRDLDNNFNRFFIAPTIAWDISDQTDLTVSLEYIEDSNPSDFGLPAFGTGVAPIPFERVVNSNPDDTIDKEYLSVGYTLEHRFSDNWRLRNEFRYVSDNYDYGVITLPAGDVDPATGNLNRLFARQFNERDNYSLYTNIQGSFNTGSIEHNLLLGVDLAREEDFGGGEAGLNAFLNPEWFNTINIFNPDYSVPKPALETAPASLRNSSTADRLGIYLQDQIYLADNLIVLAGLRYDTVEQETISEARTPFGDTVTATTQNDSAVTPRFGIVYQPTETIALYGSYAQSFTPNSGTDINDLPLEPETGDGFEVGIKADLIPNRLSATLAYFDITRQNVATTDPADVVPPFASIATGEQRSRGVELDLSGEILPGWNLIASYAYVDAEITQDNTFAVGNRLSGIPEHTASLWTTYEIQAGDLEGLGFGLGFNYVGERKGDLNNSFAVDSYFLTSAAVSYRRDNWRIQLNVDNLFDVDYIESAGGGRFRGIYPGDPLNVRASFSVTF